MFKVGEIVIIWNAPYAPPGAHGKEVEIVGINHEMGGYDIDVSNIEGETRGIVQIDGIHLRKKKPPHKDIEATRQHGAPSWDEMMNSFKELVR